MTDPVRSPKDVLEDAKLATEVVTAPDGLPSIIVRDNGDASDVALSALRSAGWIVTDRKLLERAASIAFSSHTQDYIDLADDCRAALAAWEERE